ncbi:MAG: type II toxin-antitoxin system Phd/YefM family antitoxin [Verrucomicrobia bacterium]|nr:type II toxin-antitoxin system Phd/YefM family antitoxin [Verrucomicrobiota bacterium]MBU1734828.1 type II toxin-antitoxin system Phd/YefM family antitoxin [Verrucomicrobiota bacterium]MBU1856222.1 type II toxin-antitoxin system Phd/YefM family antitoxin [Verrucomicrobiota bacterium]
MATIVSAVYARRNFGRLLNIVTLTGKDVLIERAGKRIARLTDLSPAVRQPAEKLDLRKIRGIGKTLWRSVGTDAYVKGERKQWA